MLTNVNQSMMHFIEDMLQLVLLVEIFTFFSLLEVTSPHINKKSRNRKKK